MDFRDNAAVREFAMIDVSTRQDYFLDWDHFTAAYYEVIRQALASLRFVPPDLIDDWTQSFFAEKLIAKRFLEQRPELHGRFRSWLFTMVKNHAMDELRKRRRRIRREMAADDGEDDAVDGIPAAIPVIESDALYALTYLAVALRTARWHWESIGQGHKWRIFDALVLADADPSAPRPTREELLGEFPGRDIHYLANCVTTIKRSIRSLLPLLLPAELSDHTTADARFAEWKEILCDGQLTALGWLRWAAPSGVVQSPTASASQTASIGLAVEAREQARAQPGFLFDEDDSRELPAEFDDDRLRVAQSIHLALPFSVYLGVPELTDDRSVSPRGRLAWSETQVKDTLQAVLTQLNDGGPAGDPEGLIERMRVLKRYGKQIHHTAIHDPSDSQPMTTPEFGQLLYTLASAVALVGTGRRIDSLIPRMLARNITWALERPWLDPRLAPILYQAHARLVGGCQAAD